MKLGVPPTHVSRQPPCSRLARLPTSSQAHPESTGFAREFLVDCALQWPDREVRPAAVIGPTRPAQSIHGHSRSIVASRRCALAAPPAAARCGLHRPRIATLATRFLESVNLAADTRTDRIALGRAAHKLKGASASIHAQPLRQEFSQAKISCLPNSSHLPCVARQRPDALAPAIRSGIPTETRDAGTPDNAGRWRSGLLGTA